MFRGRTQRAIVSAVLFCFGFVFVVGFTAGTLLAPYPAHAVPVEEAGPVGAAILKREVQLSVGQAILASAIVGLINTVTLFAQQFAYDLAVGLSSGCRGENACAFTKDPGRYFTSVAYDAAGEFIGNLTGPWDELGFSLCNPRIPDVGLAITLGLVEGRFQRPKPKCDFVATVNNWQNVVREARDPHALLKHVTLNFDPGVSDIGQAFQAQEAFRVHLAEKKEAEFTKRIEGGGILPQSGIISGNITTPAQVLRANFDELAEYQDEVQIQPRHIIGATLGSGEVWSAVGTTILSTFVNTLASRLLKSAFAGIFSERPEQQPNLSEIARGAIPGGTTATGAAGLSAAASALLTPQIRVSTGTFDYVTALGACPSRAADRGQFNCAIDQKFMVAIQQSTAGRPLTVSQAVEQGYLDRNRPFGFINPAENPPSEPTYDAGYPYSSLKKLRLLRIIPLGWEFAAQRINEDDRSATLGDVVDGWAKEGDISGCQGQTQDPAENRFCGLVDPNWVLKAPPATCGALVYGEALDSTGSGRQEICADIKHCVAESGQGDCNSWGYCTREKNTWRFDADTCEAQYASCDTFRPREGANVSLLENTLDFGVCSADNAGCTSHLTAQTVDSAGTVTWNPTSPRLYLDGDTEKCTAAAEGCTEFITSGGANIIANPGFERDEDGNGTPDGWNMPTSPSPWSSDGSQAFEGRGALSLLIIGGPTPPTATQIVAIQGGLTYTISLYGRGGDTTDPADSAVALVAVRNSSNATLTIADEATTCTLTSGGPMQLSAVVSGALSYVRGSCTFQAPAQATSAVVRLGRFGNAPVFADAVQLEAGGSATAFREGYPADAQKAYYRIPPDSLGCTGEESVQEAARKGCNRFSRLCRREEVGCELYSPSTGSGGVGLDTPIPAVATALDRCPQECVGYDTYLKEPSRFEPQFNTLSIPGWPTGAPQEDLYPLIPRTARSCSAQTVGCEEFTNLRTEARQYFSDLRACQRPAPDSKTYFTWEGSDTKGYQLKTWTLKQSNYDLTQTVGSFDVDAISSNTAARPPCTNYRIERDVAGEVRVICSDEPPEGDGDDATGPQAVCSSNDPNATAEERADCRAFYDEQGNIFMRRLSRTILSTEECQSFRWTGLAQLPEIAPETGETADELRVRLEEDACTTSNGFWDAGVNQCLYVGAPLLSSACPAQFSGCRAFKGNTGSNIAIVFNESFEGTTSLSERGWSGAGADMSFSSEALTSAGHSLKMSNAASGEGVARSLENISGAPEIAPGATYILALQVKGTAGRTLEVAMRDGSQEDRFPGSVPLTPEWRYVELGPLTLQAIRTVSAPELLLRNAGGGDATIFIDEVVLKEVRDTLYLVRYSWVTPSSCDTLPSEAGGGASRGAMLGCRAYTDRAGATHNLKSFASLCRPQSVGCQDLIDTRGSDSVGAQSFNMTNSGVCRSVAGPCRVDTNGDGVVTSADTVVCTVAAGATSCSYGSAVSGTPGNLPIDDVTVSADQHRFVVVDPQFACQAAQKGCQALGALQPGSATPATVYLRNDPTQYNRTLCANEARGCQAWSRSDASLAYFKDPGANQCTWKKDIAIGAETYSGWFRTAKQPVSDPAGMVNTKEKCEGYGTWNFVTSTCVDGAGNTLDGLGDSRCGGVDCLETCTKGAGGKWKQLTPTTGQCEAEAPCYGVVTVEDLEPGSGVRPRVRVDVANTFLIGGRTFGIWRNADPIYGGRAGSCPEPQATCTAFLDPTDTSEGAGGRAYYLKDNARLGLARAECNGKVSRAQGCILLDNSDDPTSRFSAVQSYLASDRERGALVAPVSLPTAGANDTNTILQVQRDRVCAEWFQCASARFSWDERERRYKTTCDILGRCNANAATPEEGGALATCGSWVRRPLLNRAPQVEATSCQGPGLSWDPVGGRCSISFSRCTELGGTWFAPSGSTLSRCEVGLLSDATYQLRDRGFGGQEYTGYSIADLYGVDQLREVNVGGTAEDVQDVRLAFTIPGLTCEPGSGDEGCGSPSEAFCTTEGQCAIAPDGGGFGDGVGEESVADTARCRGYPERTSPFPNTENLRQSAVFENAERCFTAEGEVTDCVCSYTKAEYGGERLYFAPGSPDMAAAYCFGVNDDLGRPKECRQDDDDPANDGDGSLPIERSVCIARFGECRAKTKETNVIGWYGYCLETDPSFQIEANPEKSACLSWLPVDQLSSVDDIYNQYVQASYSPGNEMSITGSTNGRYFCLLGGEVDDEDVVSIGTGVGDFASSGETVSSGDQIRVKTAPVPSSINIFRGDIKRIQIEVANMGDNGGPANGFYEFEAGTLSGDNDGSDELVTSVRDSSGNQVTLTGVETGVYQAYNFLIPPESVWWWWGGDDNYNNAPDDRPASGANAISGIVMPSWMLDTAPGGGGTPSHELTNNDWTANCDTGALSGGDYDGAYVALHFDATTQRLDYIRVGLCSVDNPLDGRIGIRMFLHPHCDYVAKIDDTAPGGARGSAPNTQRLWSGCGTGAACTVAGLPGFTLSYTQSGTQRTPFGSSDSDTDPETEMATVQWYLNHNLMDDGLQTPFAGWPYGCESRGPDGCTVRGTAAGTTDPVAPISDSGPNTFADAVSEFRKLFARSFEVYTWDPVIDQYNRWTTGGATSWDVRAANTIAAETPQFRAALGSAAPYTAVTSGTEPLAINGLYAAGSQVRGVNGFLTATARFFLWADDKHMPIRKIKIDWDDGTTSTSSGLYRNAKGSCSGTGFGSSSDACVTDPYVYEHLYACSGTTDDPNWRTGAACPDEDFRALYGGCCVFKPAVQAEDNWGFCNSGYGDAASPAGALAIGNECANDKDEPAIPGGFTPWSKFAGEVIVAP